jgi:hypothetical protein
VTAEDRRRELMPFLWSVVSKDGQIYGNRTRGSEASVTNGMNFSYPGYNESLTGAADPRIDSNDKRYNPNLTMLDWLQGKPAFRGQLAAFGAWDAFPFIFNAPRAGFLVNAGYDPLEGFPGNPEIQLLNELKADSPRDWERRTLRQSDVPHGAGVPEGAPTACSVSVSGRDRRLGARREVRGVSAIGEAGGSVSENAVGDLAIDAGIQRA